MDMRKTMMAALGGLVLSTASAGVRADSYDLQTSGTGASYNSTTGLLTINSIQNTNFQLSINGGLPVTNVNQPGAPSDFILSATFNPATGTQPFMGTATVTSFVDDVPGGPSMNMPFVGLSSSGSFTFVSQGGYTEIVFPNFTLNGSPATGGLLKLEGFTPSAGAGGSYIADFDYTTAVPLPNSALAGVTLLGGMGLVFVRRMRKSGQPTAS